LDAEEGPDEVDAQHLLELVDGLVQNRGDGANRRIVHQHVEAAEFVAGERNHVCPNVRAADIVADEPRRITDGRGDLSTLAFEHIGDDHLSTQRSKQSGLCRSLAASAPGDDCDLSRQVYQSGHGSSLFTAVPVAVIP